MEVRKRNGSLKRSENYASATLNRACFEAFFNCIHLKVFSRMYWQWFLLTCNFYFTLFFYKLRVTKGHRSSSIIIIDSTIHRQIMIHFQYELHIARTLLSIDSKVRVMCAKSGLCVVHPGYVLLFASKTW